MKTGKLLLTISAVLFMLCALMPLTACGDDLPSLDSPTEFVVDDNYNITWMTVDNTRGYELNITNSITGESQTATARRAAISLAYIEEGDYDIQVKALGDGKKYSDSKWSNAIFFQKSNEAGCIYKLIGNGSEYQLSSVSSTVESIVLQDSYRGKPVTKIGENAFRRASKITEIVVGKYVTEIGDSAFFNCGYLTKIELPETVESIGTAAFQACKLLTEFTFPSKVTSVSDNMFAYCRSLSTINLNNVTTIGKLAFSGCSSLVSIEFSDSVLAIGESAFRECTTLTTVNVGNGVTYFDSQAFRDCTALTTVNFGDGENFKLIGSSTFRNCPLTSINLPDGLEYIGNYAFYECDQLSSVNIPDSVTAVGYRAFRDTKIFTDAKEADEMLIYVDKWLVDTLYDATEKPIKKLTAAEKSTTTETDYDVYEIKSGIVGIADYVFNGCSTLEDVAVPKSIEYVGNYTFANCDNLWRFDSQDTSLKVIGIGAFAKDTKLSNLLIAGKLSNRDKLEEIGDYAFYGCSVLDFDGSSTTRRFIPTTVKRIGMYAFKGTLLYDRPDEYGVIYANDWVVGCTGQWTLNGNILLPPDAKTYSSVTLKDDTKGISDYAFSFCIDMTNLSNTGDVKYLGIGSFYYCINLSSYVFNSDIKEIPNYAFYRCQSLLLLGGLPSGLTSIGRSAFYDCKQISEVKISKNVEEIGLFAFYNCVNLTDVTLNDKIEAISPYTFYNCTKLKEIVIPSNVKTIGVSAFSGCTSLSNVEFEEGVETIGAYAFKGNTSLTQIDFADSIKNIGSYAFFNCSGVKDIDFAKVENIGDFAFAFTSSLQSLVLPDTLNSVGEAAFFYTGENAFLIKEEEIISKPDSETVTDTDTDTDEENSESGDSEIIPAVYSSIESIIIGGDVSKINEHAFYGCYFATFYVESQNKNEIWGRGWNSSYRPVVWGVTLSEDKSYVVSINVTKDTFLYHEALNVKFAPARKGYTCIGWTTKQNSTEAEYTVENVYTAPVGSVVYAIYVENTQLQEQE